VDVVQGSHHFDHQERRSDAEKTKAVRKARIQPWLGALGFGAGLRLPRHRSTTAQIGAIYPFYASEGLGSRGVYLGDDLSAGGTAWCYDPFQLYTDRVITSPNVLVLGMVGSGKSSAVKTYLYRSIGLLGSGKRPRWCGILDPKGEYEPLADALGLSRLALYPGGRITLNPLDPGPFELTTDELRRQRTEVLEALSSAVLRRELKAAEEAVLSWVADIIGRRSDLPEPTLQDVIDLLFTPTEEMVARAQADEARSLARESSEVRYGLSKLLDGPLRGMFDGKTNVKVNWQGRGVVIDLSSVHANPEALTVVMIAAMGWFRSLLAAPKTPDMPHRVQVWEEIWALLGQERTARYFQACQKLARDYGVSNIAVAHRIADLRAQADDGSASAKIATGMLADTETRILFRQSIDQVPEARQMIGLTNVEAQILPTLGRGQALWQVGTHRALVQHRIGADEWPIIDTDASLAVQSRDEAENGAAGGTAHPFDEAAEGDAGRLASSNGSRSRV
jgi:hypothetical protein